MYNFTTERRQENSSFTNLGCVSARAVCKCAVLCVGYSLFGFYFFVFKSQIVNGFSVFYTWR